MTVSLQQQRLTRRQLLLRAGGTATGIAVGGGGYGLARFLGPVEKRVRRPAPPTRTFHSRPDLRPTAVTVTGRSDASGYLFIGPGLKNASQGGPLIVDSAGEPVWFRPLPASKWATNFTVSRYQGRRVLTWWEGAVQRPAGYGIGEAVIVDDAYHELARVQAANGRQMDMHEFQLTPQGTALFTCYPDAVSLDLSAVGGRREGQVLESVFQEVDVRTGRLLMEWRSLEHIPATESYRPLEHPYDYLHLNSIQIAPDGHLLVSARHTWTLYKLHRHTGAVIWRLGGKLSDFGMGGGAAFAWQHDGRQLDERTITVFDDGWDGSSHTEPQSRAIVLELDEPAMTVRLRRSYVHPLRLLSAAMGSARILPDGGLLVGWGSQPFVSEFAADGTLVGDAAIGVGQQSYRAFRLPWRGFPRDRPAVAVGTEQATGRRTIYVSWNGSTEVASWQVQSGPAARNLTPVATVPRVGFETAIPIEARRGYVAVTALDSSAAALATSHAIAL